MPTCFPFRRPSPPPFPPPPSFTTTLYHTPLGPASLTWSRSFLGLSLYFLLPLPSPASIPSSPSSSASSCLSTSSPTRFHLRPSLLWRRRGSRRFRLRHHNPATLVDFSWDLSRAAFSGGGPEPTAGFFLSVAVDGEVVLLIGDDDRRKGKGKLRNSSIGTPAVPASRREHVVVADDGGGRWPCEYVTTAWAGGRERKVSVEIGGRAEKDVRLCIAVDGKRILQVKRLRWKFRGSERIDLDNGIGTSTILVSWDVHNYLFPSSTTATSTASHLPTSESNHAIIIFRFDAEPKPQLWPRSATCTTGVWGVYGLPGRGGTVEKVTGFGVPKQRRLMKTRSASSTSSVASSGSGWSVAEWQSTEENELKEIIGFSLLITFARR